MKIFILLSLLLISNIASVHAMDDTQYNEADARYLAAVNGNKNSVRKTIRYFKGLTAPAPYDTLVKSYLGSLESIMAKHVYMPWNKMKYVDSGSEKMDEALDEITEIHDTTKLNGTSLSILVRLNIAQSYFQFPEFLNRYQDSKDLVNEILSSPHFKSTNTRIKNSTYELAAAMAEKEGDKQKQASFLTQIQHSD